MGSRSETTGDLELGVVVSLEGCGSGRSVASLPDHGGQERGRGQAPRARMSAFSADDWVAGVFEDEHGIEITLKQSIQDNLVARRCRCITPP